MNTDLLQRLQIVADEETCWTLLADALRSRCGAVAVRRPAGPAWFEDAKATAPVTSVQIRGAEFILCVEHDPGIDLHLPLSITVTHFLNERYARLRLEQRELVSEATRRLSHDLRGDVSALSDLAMVILGGDVQSVPSDHYRQAIEETEHGAFARLEQIGLLGHVMRDGDDLAAPLAIALEYAAAKAGVALESADSFAKAAVSGKVLHEIMSAILWASQRMPMHTLVLSPHADGWAIELCAEGAGGGKRETWASLGTATLSLTGVVVTTFGGRTWLERTDAGKPNVLGFTLPPA